MEGPAQWRSSHTARTCCRSVSSNSQATKAFASAAAVGASGSGDSALAAHGEQRSVARPPPANDTSAAPAQLVELRLRVSSRCHYRNRCRWSITGTGYYSGGRGIAKHNPRRALADYPLAQHLHQATANAGLAAQEHDLPCPSWLCAQRPGAVPLRSHADERRRPVAPATSRRLAARLPGYDTCTGAQSLRACVPRS